MSVHLRPAGSRHENVNELLASERMQELVVELATGLDADRVGLCSTVPGVLDEEGEVIERIDAFETVADALGGSDATDVTGGMAGKVRTLLALDAPASVFGPASVDRFLAGEQPGTTIYGTGEPP